MTTTEYNIAVNDYSDRLLRYALKLTRDKAWSEDLVQESMIKLWTNRDKVSPSHAKPFLYRVLYNKLVDDQRKKKVRQFTTAPTQNIKTNSNLETKDLIEKAFEQLNVNQKQIIMLRDWDGYSYEEIADILELALGVVKVQLFRARKKMRAIVNSLNSEIKPCYEN